MNILCRLGWHKPLFTIDISQKKISVIQYCSRCNKDLMKVIGLEVLFDTATLISCDEIYYDKSIRADNPRGAINVSEKKDDAFDHLLFFET